ncbi:ribosome maturation factor RimM [Lactobacillus nasalidis]|uniref:Ribosome maturation factor RimM n=1 Tax=Lactobacillus nasalidis TaxID=2797258 RepID=A0ABQ3W5U2_9LACO|nr:ribosome maturation factor RimM [Lactobacillus nasalidis]GHV97555.1 ribosome maturation factor RimM [Lactobacillus nasalidis]GHV98814.1 ribosome maturation factor RimM [Lactobacillus nasalidis]GHW00760.1 ribosome maturation factor RimM [Lactobacillus nasalidis]
MNYYNVGKIVATHGLKGEVKVALTTDFPEDRFKEGSRLYLGREHREVTVASGRPFKQFWLVTFAEITDIDQAEKLKGTEITVSEEDQGELPDGVYYYRDLLGCRVVDDASGELIGELTDIEAPGANDIWEVTEQSGKSFWIPYIPEVVKSVDIAEKEVRVELMEGLR